MSALDIFQGDDYDGSVWVTDKQFQNVDLTGYTALGQIRAGVADDSPIVVATLDTTVVVEPNADGEPVSRVDIHLDHAVTETLTEPLRWDLQVTAPDGRISTVDGGVVRVEREVTRP